MFKNIIAYTKEFFAPAKKSSQPNRTPRVISRDEHGINRRQVSYEAIKTVRNLQQAGFEAYVVGGAVRDLMLGVTPKDFDVVTNATPEQIKRCQRRAIIIGRRFRLVHVMFGREIIECSTFRALHADGVEKDRFGRVISDNVFGEMWEDAARRDFTINALYYNPTTEEVIDYHNGMQDILEGVVRIIGDAKERYREDPVRMLRAVRIASKLNFKIDEETLSPIKRQSGLLSNVPEARLFDEALKLLTCGKAVKCLEVLQSLNLYRNVIPLLDVALKEPHGEEFLMLAMQRTDERISIGKKVSPSFLFATLLWPMTHRIFEEHIARGQGQIPAMIAAGQEVLHQQCERLAIQNRFVEDILTIWVLQVKLLRRSSVRATFGLLNIPKFRAGYDFMLLRSILGLVDKEIVDWWTQFQEADEDRRHEMVQKQAELNAQARKVKRGEVKKPSKAQIKKQLMQEAQTWQEVRDTDRLIEDLDIEDDVLESFNEMAGRSEKPAKPPRKPRTRRAPRKKEAPKASDEIVIVPDVAIEMNDAPAVKAQETEAPKKRKAPVRRTRKPAVRKAALLDTKPVE